ncbi:microfibril-associated glycoprotein 4-like [Cochliomyia hominivorax]
MNLYYLVPIFIISTLLFGLKSQEISADISWVDEIIVLKQMFANLQEIKNSIHLWNSRYEEFWVHNLPSQKETPIFDIRFDTLPLKCQNQSIPKNCAEATSCTHRSGIYKILVDKYGPEPFLVECDAKTEGGDWILIQRRQDGSVDFYRDWEDYKKGFGKIDGEFFIGLDKLHAITNYDGPQELLIVLRDKNETRFAKYNHFVVGNEKEFYTLHHLGVYTGDAGNSLGYHLGSKFTTKDQDHDNKPTTNCAVEYTGAWWYNFCHHSNLNGKYGDNSHAKGVNWHAFRNHNVSIEYVKMMIRRRRF